MFLLIDYCTFEFDTGITITVDGVFLSIQKTKEMRRVCYSQNTNKHENHNMQVPSDNLETNYLRMKRSIQMSCLLVILLMACQMAEGINSVDLVPKPKSLQNGKGIFTLKRVFRVENSEFKLANPNGC
jgi:hypothetical protein